MSIWVQTKGLSKSSLSHEQFERDSCQLQSPEVKHNFQYAKSAIDWDEKIENTQLFKIFEVRIEQQQYIE